MTMSTGISHTALIPSLCLNRCPSAVLRSVISLVVDSVKRVLGGPRPHVGQEGLEGSSPSFTDTNSASTIEGIEAMPGIQAPLFHACPDDVLRGGVVPDRATVSSHGAKHSTGRRYLEALSMRKGLMVAILLLCLPMVGEGQAIRYYPDGATITPGKPTSQYIRYYPSVASSSTLLAGLVSYWNLDEESGTRVDSVGSNDLTDNNTVGFDAGVNGSAASFVAANSESLTVADTTSLSPAGANASFTISAWAKIPSTGLVGQNMVVVKWGGGGNAYEREYYIALIANETADYMDFFVGNGIGAAQSFQTFPTPTFTDGAWHHILAWHDGDESKMKAQINGGTVLEASSVGTFDGNGTFAVGRTGSFGSFFSDLTIDEVAYWDRVLTEDERTELYAAGAGKFYPF